MMTLQQNILDLSAEIRMLQREVEGHTRTLEVLRQFIKDVAEWKESTGSSSKGTKVRNLS